MIALYDIATGLPADTTLKRYVAPEEARSVSSMGLKLMTYPDASLNQYVRLSIRNTAFAKVENNNEIVGISGGETSVYIRLNIQGETDVYDMSFPLVVTEIPEGTYFLRNKTTECYADIDYQIMENGRTIHQWEFHGGNTQKWVFTHLGDGTYSIHSKNASTKYYLGVSGDSSSVDQPIVLRTGAITSGMKWTIEKTENDAYKLIPKSGEANGCALATSTSFATNGAILVQGDYIDNNSYRDEWYIFEQAISYINYYDATFSDNTELLNNIPEANEFASFTFWNFFNVAIHMKSEAVYYSTTADDCPEGESVPCSNDCGTNCYDEHHKNGLVISDQIFNDNRQADTIYILWTNHPMHTFCTLDQQTSSHKTVDWIAVVYGSRPVIHFMNICGNNRRARIACMALNLAHETAHTLGMRDVYDDEGHDSENTYVCIMERFDQNTAYAYYQDILNGTAEPFCQSCMEEMREHTSHITIMGN